MLLPNGTEERNPRKVFPSPALSVETRESQLTLTILSVHNKVNTHVTEKQPEMLECGSTVGMLERSSEQPLIKEHLS